MISCSLVYLVYTARITYMSEIIVFLVRNVVAIFDQSEGTELNTDINILSVLDFH